MSETIDHPPDPSLSSPPVIGPGHTYASVTEKISSIILTRKPGRGWLVGVAVTFMLTMLLLFAITVLFVRGVGIWGINVPIAWGFAIVNFVWWIGIGHAGTLISAILLLLKQSWRTSINRFAEAMTLFAVTCAGLFPILHLGRPQYFYWLFPYPNTMQLWPQFRSPLEWDVFAVSTYATISALFWYVGLIPDLATMRDRAQSRLLKVIYGVLSLGWRGSAMHWHRYEVAYVLLAGLATPLVVSVHTVVSFDFAVAQLPGWHATIFPPYFVAGAIYSGFAMVITLCVPLRKFYGLEDFITLRHLNNMGKVMLATGLIVAYGYIMETFMAFYGGDRAEMQQFLARFKGPYALGYWSLITCNVLIPGTLLWFRRIRRNPAALWVISIVVNIGMWLERFVIVISSLARNHMQSKWGMYYPTFWDWATYLGTIGLFLFLILIFIRVLPVISVFEMRELVSHARHESTGESAEEKGQVEQ